MSVRVLGIGERAGNAALEEVVAGLSEILRMQVEVRKDRLSERAELVALAAGRPIPDGKAIVGSSAFTHESGIHVSGLLLDPGTYESLNPEHFGRTRRIVLGKHSGRAAIAFALSRVGLACNSLRLSDLLERVRARATATKQIVGAEDLRALLAEANAVDRTRVLA